MTAISYISDKLVNFVANLGTDRDKAAGSTFGALILTDAEIDNAYRFAWLPRKIVDIPAFDACRQWRAWQADKKQIESIEAEEKRLNVPGKIREALTKGRLYGGAAVFIGTGESDPSKEMNPERIGIGGIKYLTVMTRRDLKAGDIEFDPLSPLYGMPAWYEISTGTRSQLKIHPSRLVLFRGNPIPDTRYGLAYTERGWGDSVLLSVVEAIKNADATVANVASMVFEAKVDVISIPNFMECIGDPKYRAQMLERMSLAAMAKGINGMLVLDKEEEYQSKSASFASLPDIMDRMLQIVSGAADIPATRLLSQAPAGMSATGESDTRNYYDRLSSMQTLDMDPAMAMLNECLIRSALGSRPPEVHYNWRSLWQPTAKEHAEIGKLTAETIKTIADTRLINDDALSQAAANMLIESGVMPGLEAAIEEFGIEPEEEELPEVTPAVIP